SLRGTQGTGDEPAARGQYRSGGPPSAGTGTGRPARALRRRAGAPADAATPPQAARARGRIRRAARRCALVAGRRGGLHAGHDHAARRLEGQLPPGRPRLSAGGCAAGAQAWHRGVRAQLGDRRRPALGDLLQPGQGRAGARAGSARLRVADLRAAGPDRRPARGRTPRRGVGGPAAAYAGTARPAPLADQPRGKDRRAHAAGGAGGPSWRARGALEGAVVTAVRLRALEADITTLRVDAVVNAANPAL